MGNFIKLFKKVDGFRVLSQYTKSHVLLHALLLTALEGTSKKSLEIVRLSVEKKLLNKLKRKNRKYVEEFLLTFKQKEKGKNPSIIWFCWLQGIDNAPEIVKACYRSLKRIKDYEVKLVTNENLDSLVTIPAFIIEKYRKGIIGNAHFADILRLELLIKYGGTWIDSTVLCTSDTIPDYLMRSDLFVYRILKPGLDGHSVSASNWFISASNNNPILVLTRNLLYKYWSENNGLIDYYIFHYFLEISMEAYPKLTQCIPPVSSETPHILLLRLLDQYNEDIYQSIINQSCFHKLSYKYDESKNIEGTFLQHILESE